MLKPGKTLKLEIELRGDEVDTFIHLAGTNDSHLQQGIAKSLVLGAAKVVDPAEVARDIDAFVKVYEYGIGLASRPPQDVADFLLFTREQLELPAVKRAVTSWSEVFRSTATELQARRNAPKDDQYTWFGVSDTIERTVGFLREKIALYIAEAPQRPVRIVASPRDVTGMPIGEPDDFVYSVPGPD